MITRYLWLTLQAGHLYNPRRFRLSSEGLSEIMVKADLVDIIAREVGITKVKAELAVDSIIHALKESLARGDRIELRGFGVFEVKRRAPRKARDPRTGETMDVPERNVVVFRPGRALEARLAELPLEG